MPKITTNTSLLFHHQQFPSVTVPAGKTSDVPEWVVRTTTFGAHAKAGNIVVDEDPSAPLPRANKAGQRIKPPRTSEE
jgi:hypothetical protein